MSQYVLKSYKSQRNSFIIKFLISILFFDVANKMAKQQTNKKYIALDMREIKFCCLHFLKKKASDYIQLMQEFN